MTFEETLYQILVTDTTLATLCPGGVWHRVIPETVSQTALVYWRNDAEPIVVKGGQVALVHTTYIVKAVTPEIDPRNAEVAIARVEELLAGAGWHPDLLACLPQRRFSYDEIHQSGRYWHVGVEFLVELRA